MQEKKKPIWAKIPNAVWVLISFACAIAFFGKQNESLASLEKRPRPYHKKARQTTVRVP